MKWYKANIKNISNQEYLYFYNLMTDEKKAHIKALKSDSDKKLSIAGEMLVKNGVSELFGLSVADIKILKTESGKPYLENIDYHISISHSGEYAVCAVDKAPIGIDIEKIREVSIDSAKRFCNQNELEYIQDPNEDAILRFFEIWTAKEAEYKRLPKKIKSFKDINTFSIIKEYQKFENYIICISKEG